MNKIVRPLLLSFTSMTVLTGAAYPLITYGIGRALFPHQIAGSLIEAKGQVLGSRLIGQNFSSPKYFWGRLSATSPQPYNAAGSGGSNLGPTNPALLDEAKGRIDALKKADAGNGAPIPVDLVTSSASGLDPEISIAAARYQAPRVARARKLPIGQVNALIDRFTRSRQLGVLGEPRVNVLELNLALDGVSVSDS